MRDFRGINDGSISNVKSPKFRLQNLFFSTIIVWNELRYRSQHHWYCGEHWRLLFSFSILITAQITKIILSLKTRFPKRGARRGKPLEIRTSALWMGLIISTGHRIQGLVRRDPGLDCAAERYDALEPITVPRNRSKPRLKNSRAAETK